MGLHVAVRRRLRGPVSHNSEHALSSRLGGGKAQVTAATLRPDRTTKPAADPWGSSADWRKKQICLANAQGRVRVWGPFSHFHSSYPQTSLSHPGKSKQKKGSESLNSEKLSYTNETTKLFMVIKKFPFPILPQVGSCGDWWSHLCKVKRLHFLWASVCIFKSATSLISLVDT